MTKPRISKVAACDNLGNTYAALFMGDWNIITTMLMLSSLMSILDGEDQEWSANKNFYMDKAVYHNYPGIK